MLTRRMVMNAICKLFQDEESEGNYNLSDLSSLASFGESTTKPELLVNLYYKDLTGRLTVEVIRAANLKKNFMIIDPGE